MQSDKTRGKIRENEKKCDTKHTNCGYVSP